MKLSYECKHCGKSGTRDVAKNSVPINLFCSRNCKNLWQKYGLLGENNPNFNNTWSDERKEKFSEYRKTCFTPEIRQKISDRHKGKTLSQETLTKIHGHRTKESYSRPCSEESKKLIGIKSAEKFKDKDYCARYRKTMEVRGHWLPLRDKEPYIIYADAADWIENMFAYQDLETLERVNSVGLFHSKTNKSGYVRDHKYSRRAGFVDNVFPEILRHPANCEFILHSRNSGKSFNSSITIEELFESIENFTSDWKEQELCLSLINKYRLGNIWNLDEFIKKVYNE